MKNVYRLLLLFLMNQVYTAVFSQAGTWTWVKGDSAANSPGNYGTMGVPSPLNDPPGRYACGYWTDTAGNFWLYGGLGFDLTTNATATKADLWKFEPATTNWTWIGGSDVNNASPVIAGAKGVFNASNEPGGIAWGPFTWVTPDNHLWLYGGGTTGSTKSSDLWQFAPEINEWAWMGNFGPINYGYQGYGDSASMPGFRWEGNSAWVDSLGNLWFFGGWDHDFVSYNDVWMYKVSTGVWTWMSGSNDTANAGVYGTIGVPSVNTYPPARATNLFWKDAGGDFWLVGGTNSSPAVNNTYYTDVWKFNPKTLEWTWADGNKGTNADTADGKPCEINQANEEGARWENRAVWKICDDLIINCGGWNASPTNDFNDLWGYLPYQKLWINIWQGTATGNYGAKGIADASNSPYPKDGAVGFKDKNNNLWLFGGSSYGFMNDLWEYVLDTACLGNYYCNNNCAVFSPKLNADKDTICSGDSAMICAPTGFTLYQWSDNDTGTCIHARAAGNYYVTVTDNTGCTVESNHISIAAYPTSQVSITQRGDTLTSFNAVSYEWFKNGVPITGATSGTYIADGAGAYSVAITDTNGCMAASNTVTITGINNLHEVNVQIFPNPSTGAWQLVIDDNLIGGQLEVYDAEGRLVFQSEIRNPKSEISFNASPGVYLLQIASPEVHVVRKLVRL